jgi:glyoxylase-like metal-dependent hydrolase (beta-lactamase superfamily II)
VEERVIVKTLPVGPLQANCYIVGCEKTKLGAVIDPGDEADHILGVVKDLGLRVTHVLLTHAHFDHMAAAAALVKATGAALAVHPDDLPLLNAAGGALFFGLQPPPVPDPTMRLVAGQEIAIGEVTLRVLHTPGHSPGHVTFYEPDQRVIFDGDVLFAQGIGRADLPGGSYATLMHSINEQLMKLPDDTRVYSGHGPATTIGQERVANPWL